MATLEAEVKSLAAAQKKDGDTIQGLAKSFKVLTDRLEKTPMFNAEAQFGGIHAVKGNLPKISQGASLAKLVGSITDDSIDAKLEINEIHNVLHKSLVQERDAGSRYEYGGKFGDAGQKKFLFPLCLSYLPDSWLDNNKSLGMKQLIQAGTDGSMDLQDEMKWVRRKMLERMGYSGKALSWLNELTGGALVAPPEQGELIELLRNKEALVNAGARTVPLPPQGRLKFPRQTAPGLAYWLGENTPILESIPGTGEIVLQAKKLAVFMISPNELIRFASPAAEALMRDDMTKDLALGLDLAGLEGPGTDTQPRGVTNLQGITTLTSSQPNINGGGNRVVGEDIYRFLAAVEENNAQFTGFIMRPKTLYKFYQLRFDSVSQGDRQGGFLFNLIREAGDGLKPMLAGKPVTTSTQVSQVMVQGTMSNGTYIVGGWWEDFLIGMFGAIEFAASTQAGNAFQQDQTYVRGILSADCAARHDAAFVQMPFLDTSL